MEKQGIDVSTWQGVINWPKVKAGGIDFAMIRVGFGSPTGDTCTLDKTFIVNITSALDAGVDVGVYFYSYATSVAAIKKEAAWVLYQLAPYAGRVLYPVVLDLEDQTQRSLGKATLTSMVAAFCEAIEGAGWYAMLYCNLDWCRNRLDMDALKVCDLWLAQWAAAPSNAYTFGIWQRSNVGSVPGISGNVDLDVAYKDYPAIIRQAGLNGTKAAAKDKPQAAAPAPVDGKIRTASELVAQAVNIAKNYDTLYVMGCFGAPLTGSNVTRYCNNHSYNKAPARTAMIKAAANKNPPVYGFDCVCLIKGILWGWCGDASKVYGGAQYTANGVPDIGADSMIKVCPYTSTDFTKIVPGAVTWMSGHIGIYIGDGLAVECSPKWANRVQITACNCTKKGYNRRNWTKWGLLPYITYQEDKEDDEMDEEKLRAMIRETVEEVLDERDPMITDLRDVPSYWQAAAKAMLESGAVNGGTSAEVNPTDLNMRRETFKAAMVAVTYTDAVAAKIGAENAPENDAENGEENTP